MSVLRLFLFMLTCVLPLTPSCSSVSKVHKGSTVHATKSPLKNGKGQLVVLDAGHGGFDIGANSHSLEEKALALSTAFLTKKYLTRMGYRVVLTRNRDVFIPLKKRAEVANQVKSHLFVSLHYNAARHKSATGIEVFYYEGGKKWRSSSSKKLAKCVLSRLLDRTGAPSRGVKGGNFHVIRETRMPAILIEGGFITHHKERGRLKDQKYIDQIACAIAEGIDRYFQS